MATAVYKKERRKGRLDIPPEVEDELTLEEGDAFDVTVENDRIVLIRREGRPERHPDIDAELALALEEAGRGETVGPFESMEEYDAYTKKNL